MIVDYSWVVQAVIYVVCKLLRADRLLCQVEALRVWSDCSNQRERCDDTKQNIDFEGKHFFVKVGNCKSWKSVMFSWKWKLFKGMFFLAKVELLMIFFFQNSFSTTFLTRGTFEKVRNNWFCQFLLFLNYCWWEFSFYF